MIRKARRICKSSALGAVEKVVWDSSEKSLLLKIAERRIVSALSMRGLCELDGPPVNEVPIHAAGLERARKISPRVFAASCDPSYGSMSD